MTWLLPEGRKKWLLLLAVLFLPPGLTLCALAFSQRPALVEQVEFGKVVLDRSGDLMKIQPASDGRYRLRVALEDVEPQAIRAILHYEDRYFYQHPGINPIAMCRAMKSLVSRGGRRIGASTISMQVARLRGKLRTTTFSGKLRQIWHALVLEWHYGKDEILEAYLNLAPYGGNIEGIEAAARIYFNKPAASLTPMECVALAVVPQNPARRNPVKGGDFDSARQRLATALWPQSGGTKAALHVRAPADLPFSAPHLSLELLERSEDTVIRTCIEGDLQKMLARSLAQFRAQNARKGIANAAAMIVDWGSMDVRALAGSADFTDEGISGQIDGTRSARSPGSTLKPFIYALALDQGLIHPMTMLADTPRSFGGYDPENFDRGFRGPVTAQEALKSSRNLPAIRLAERLANPDLYGFLQMADVRLPHDAAYYGLALALGGAEVSMRQLATMYGMLANLGIWRPLRYRACGEEKMARRLVSPEAAYLALWMLEDPQARIRSANRLVPYRCKTGTSNGFRDAWTAGIIGRYVVVVWVGNFDNSANPYFVGGQTALPLFVEIAGALGSMRKLSDTFADKQSGLNLAKADVCAATGDFAHGQCGEIVETLIIPGVSPVRDSGILKKILIDRQTGLRACGDTAADEVWWEFWPSDMKEIFAMAGIHKPPPPEWLPHCSHEREMAHGRAPRIMLPKKNVIYQKKMTDSAYRLPLMAAGEADARNIHWYAGQMYIGSARPGEILFWQPGKPGVFDLLAVDDRGRGSRQKCRINAIP